MVSTGCRQADGNVTLLTREMTFPNGIAFSPDEKTLYVANSDPKKAIWMAFPVHEDGTLGTGPRLRRRDSGGRHEEGSARRHEGRSRRATCSRPVPAASWSSPPTAPTWALSPPARPPPTAAGARTARSFTSRPTCTWDGSS